MDKILGVKVRQFVTWLRFAGIGFVWRVFFPITLLLPRDLGLFGRMGSHF
jgi:hypothetical protein